jgi:hypothetical protein
MRWAGHVAQIGEKMNAYKILLGKSEKRHHREHKDIGGCTILKWILEKWDGIVWIRLIWLRIETSRRLL